MTLSRVHHIPRWLTCEPFTFKYFPLSRGEKFYIELDHGFAGYGVSLADAAKAARKERKKWK